MYLCGRGLNFSFRWESSFRRISARCLHAHLRDCNMLGRLFYFALNRKGVRICSSFQSLAPASTTWLSSQTGASASNFPTHLIWKPAKIGERPYKYVKQEVQITQWCKYPVIDALLKTIKILEKLQCWWMCFPPDAVWRYCAEFGWCIVLFVRILFWISTTSWRPGGGTVGGTKKLGATAILFVGSMVEFCQSV